MPYTSFPDPRFATPEGIVAVGGDLHPVTLATAYGQGIFPWPHEGLPLLWFCPPRRAVLPFDRLHVSRSLARERRRSGLRFTIDRAFAGVIEGCRGATRPGQGGTWITPEMCEAFRRFHALGHAHSVEAWDGETGELVGGMYGVDAGGAFGGESMFYARPYASKLALLHLIDHLRRRGLDWMDIQQLTPHMEAMGAVEIPRAAFLRKLRETQARGLVLFP